MRIGLNTVFWLILGIALTACAPTRALPTPLVLPTAMPTGALARDVVVAANPTLPTIMPSRMPATIMPSQTPIIAIPSMTPRLLNTRVPIVPTATITDTPPIPPSPTNPNIALPLATSTPGAAQQGDAFVSNKQGVNVRRGPSVDFGAPLFLLEENTPLELLAISDNLLWYKVEAPDGRQGWAYSQMMTVLHEPESLPVEHIALPTPVPVVSAQTASVVVLPGRSTVSQGAVVVPGGAPVGASGSMISIDLMVLYSERVRKNHGDVEVQNGIQGAIATLNQAFNYSGVNARFNLVHMQAVEMDDSGDMSKNLGWVMRDPGVATLRDTYQADIVTLIVETTTDKGGLSNQMTPNFASNPLLMAPRAFFTMVYGGLYGTRLIMPHEIGHIMGLEHEVAEAKYGDPIFSDGYAYQDPEGRFSDIMSYNTGCKWPCPHIVYFSNPNIYYGGSPMGSSTSNAARILNYTAPYVAQFRTGRSSFVMPTAVPVLPPLTPTPMPTSRDPLPTCTTTATDAATLSNAILAANADQTTIDVICLTPQGSYTVSSSPTFSAFPDVLSPIIIVGNGARIERTGTSEFRFFNVIAPGNLTLYDLTLKNGLVKEPGSAIQNKGGQLTLYSVVLTENISSAFGSTGAIYARSGITRIFNSRLEANSSGWGGAIAVVRGSLEVSGSVFYNNAAQKGSAIYATYGAIVSIHDSCILRNTSSALMTEENGMIDASQNWWGMASGPMYYTSLLATGADMVEGSVIADRYHFRAPAACPTN